MARVLLLLALLVLAGPAALAAQHPAALSRRVAALRLHSLLRHEPAPAPGAGAGPLLDHVSMPRPRILGSRLRFRLRGELELRVGVATHAARLRPFVAILLPIR